MATITAPASFHDKTVKDLQLRQKYNANLVALKRVAPESEEAKRKYNFRVQSHFILLDANGEVVQEWFGSVPADNFVAAFDETLAN